MDHRWPPLSLFPAEASVVHSVESGYAHLSLERLLCPHQGSSWDQRCLERPQEGRLEEDLKLENHHCLRTKGSQSPLASMELDTGSSKRMNLWFVPQEPQEGGKSQPSRQRTVCTVETCVKSSPHWGRQRGQADLCGRRTHDPHIFLILSQESQQA